MAKLWECVAGRSGSPGCYDTGLLGDASWIDSAVATEPRPAVSAGLGVGELHPEKSGLQEMFNHQQGSEAVEGIQGRQHSKKSLVGVG